MDAGVDLTHMTPADWNASFGDPRITHVAAIDPGLMWALIAQSVADIVSNKWFFGLGAPDTRLLAADFDTSGLAKLLPDAAVGVIASTMHFTALPLCKPNGVAILLEEEDDAVCSDPAGTDRAAVHDRMIAGRLADLGL